MATHYANRGAERAACGALPRPHSSVPKRVDCMECCWYRIKGCWLGVRYGISIGRLDKASSFIRRMSLWLDRYKELKDEQDRLRLRRSSGR